MTPRIGQRWLSIAGFAVVLVALLVAAAALYSDHVGILPFAAAAMLWDHYWDAENVVTIPAMVAKPEYRGTATGFAYIFVKLPAFLSIFLFPVLFSAISKANAMLFTAVFPLTGLLAAVFILPEVYGCEHDASAAPEVGASPALPHLGSQPGTGPSDRTQGRQRGVEPASKSPSTCSRMPSI